jgi:hypothetical protein
MGMVQGELYRTSSSVRRETGGLVVEPSGASAAAMATATAFTEYVSERVEVLAVAAAWCPTMDLLALVTADGQLAVHRLNWHSCALKELWKASPEQHITTLTWRPDGAHALSNLWLMGSVKSLCSKRLWIPPARHEGRRGEGHGAASATVSLSIRTADVVSPAR